MKTQRLEVIGKDGLPVVYHAGQRVYTRAGKYHGRVAEVLPDCDSGAIVVDLHRPYYTGSDERDDAGIPAGTKCKQAIICRVQIADDPLCQVDTFHVVPRDEDEAVNECANGHTWTGDAMICAKCGEPAE